MGKKILILNIIKNLRKRLKLILFTALVSIGAVWIFISFVVTPEYQATSQVLIGEAPEVLQDGTALPALDGPAIDQISSAIVRSPEVLRRVIMEMGLEDKTSIRILHDQIAFSKTGDSQIYNITVTGDNRKEAAAIADAVASIFIEEAPKMMITNELTLISSAPELASASPIEENLIFSLGVAGAFGLIVGTLLAFIVEMLNSISKTESQKRKGTKEKLQTVFK